MKLAVLVPILCIGVAACSSPKPVLYSNAHLAAVGQDQADQDIAECQLLAEEAGASPANGAAADAAKGTVAGGAVGAASGAVGGAIAGGVGRGAMIGAAVGATVGLLRSAFRPSRPSTAYVNYVNRCSSDRGYEAVGWD